MIAKDMKRGDVVVYNGSPIIVENLQVQSPSHAERQPCINSVAVISLPKIKST